MSTQRLSPADEARVLRRDLAREQERAALRAETVRLQSQLVEEQGVHAAREWARRVNGQPAHPSAATDSQRQSQFLPPAGPSWYIPATAVPLGERLAVAEGCAGTAAELTSEYRALEAESRALTVCIDRADLTTDSNVLAVWEARKKMLDRYLPSKLVDRDTAQRASDQAASAVADAERYLEGARVWLARLEACADGDLEVELLGIGRWKEEIRLVRAGIATLSGGAFDAAPQGRPPLPI